MFITGKQWKQQWEYERKFKPATRNYVLLRSNYDQNSMCYNNNKRNTLFLWRILAQSGFFGSYDALWSQWSWIDLFSKETQNPFLEFWIRSSTFLKILTLFLIDCQTSSHSWLVMVLSYVTQHKIYDIGLCRYTRSRLRHRRRRSLSTSSWSSSSSSSWLSSSFVIDISTSPSLASLFPIHCLKNCTRYQTHRLGRDDVAVQVRHPQLCCWY